MNMDLKDRVPAFRKRKKRRGKAWLVIGIAVAAAVGIAMVGGQFWLNGDFSEAGDTVTVPAPPPTAKSANAGAADKARPTGTEKPVAGGQNSGPAPVKAAPIAEPRFTFYKILPEKEVIIPESEIKTLKREESQNKPSASQRYMLQAGSFTNQEDAEKLKARLAQIKIKARLEMIKLDNAAWFRVKIGPYATLADADKIRSHLRQNNIDSVVQRATAP